MATKKYFRKAGQEPIRFPGYLIVNEGGQTTRLRDFTPEEYYRAPKQAARLSEEEINEAVRSVDGNINMTLAQKIGFVKTQIRNLQRTREDYEQMAREQKRERARGVLE